MSQVTFTITICFRDETHDKTIVASENDTAFTLTQYFSKYAYGGLPVYLIAGRKKVKDSEVVKSFKEEKLSCLPV